MRLHFLQHVPFEGLGTIQPFFLKRHVQFEMTHLYASEPLPGIEDFDFLVIMGGPMGVHDTEQYPWLMEEKRLIGEAIEAGKTLLGICLGAQMIADVLGAEVRPMGYREIGWFPISLSPEAPDRFYEMLGRDFIALHWHGDTFEIPSEALPFGSSEACPNQGYIYADRVVGLQFHLEFDKASVDRLARNCPEELDGTRWVQTADQMRDDPEQFANGHARMDRLLDHLLELTQERKARQ